MRKLKVRHAPLPGIGDVFELVATSGLAVQVVSQRSGRRELAIGSPGADQPTITVSLTRAEATAIASLLLGAHIDLVTERRD